MTTFPPVNAFGSLCVRMRDVRMWDGPAHIATQQQVVVKPPAPRAPHNPPQRQTTDSGPVHTASASRCTPCDINALAEQRNASHTPTLDLTVATPPPPLVLTPKQQRPLVVALDPRFSPGSRPWDHPAASRRHSAVGSGSSTRGEGHRLFQYGRASQSEGAGLATDALSVNPASAGALADPEDLRSLHRSSNRCFLSFAESTRSSSLQRGAHPPPSAPGYLTGGGSRIRLNTPLPNDK